MKVHVYPADRHGCGHHRLIWPAEALMRQGHDITIIEQQARKLMMYMNGDDVVDVEDAQAGCHPATEAGVPKRTG